MIRWLAPVLLCGCADLIGITEPTDFEVVELTVSTGTLMPAFDPTITRYEVAVGYPDATIEIRAAASDPQATIEIGGEPTDQGMAVAAVAIGDTVVAITATTPSGVARTYEIALHRPDLIIAFAAPRSVATQIPGMISRVEIADLDGNGSLDLAAIATAEVGLLTNDGAAQFSFRSMFSYGFVRGLAVRDLDFDGRPDLVVSASGQLQVSRNAGNATFDSPIGCGGSPSPGAFAMFQLDTDGRIDLALADQNGRLMPMTGMPSTCFASMPAMDQTVSPTQLTVVVSGAFDNVQGDDLATLDPMAGRIFVHRNLGGALSLEQVDVGPTAKPVELVAADTDGDGLDELIWIDRQTDDIVIQPFPGPRGTSYHVDGSPRSLNVVDVDGDGALDVLVLDNAGITVLHNEAGGTFSKKSIAMALPGVQRIAAADLDGNGRADLVAANFTSSLTVHMGVAP